ncbi:MAG: type II toxin-antitoxin system prevent-host-death family antitoxin [Deltaproteobacteria bacterium]|nr:type II toxin-antitoxin system prevent-host-death family antitoxin [Deltaproteobacteria bacterium]
MRKTVSATEAKVHLGAMLEWAANHPEAVVIESRGRPRAVLLSFEEYQKLEQARQAVRKQEALQRLEALADRVAARGAGLEGHDAEAVADRLVREAAEGLARSGRVRFRGR